MQWRKFQHYFIHSVIWLVWYLFVGIILFYLELRHSQLVSLFLRPRNNLKQIEKICFVSSTHNSGLGDIIIRNSIISFIHKLYPRVSIFLLADYEAIEQFKSFYISHSWIDDFIRFPQRNSRSPMAMVSFFLTMRKHRFDLCITIPPAMDYMPEWFLHPFIYLCGIPERIGYHSKGSKVGKFLTKPITFSSTGYHWSEYAVAYAQALGAKPELKPQELAPFLHFQTEVLAELKAPQPIVAVHPGGSKHWNRRWPLERYQEICLKICQELGASVYLIGGAEENADNEWIRKTVCTVCPRANIYNLSGATLNQTFNYLDAANLFVGNDSGPMHMAVAVGTPVIAIFGPSPYLFFGPDKFDPKHMVISKNLLCQSLHSRHLPLNCDCPKNYDSALKIYPKCLTDIDVDEVWFAIKKQIYFLNA